MKKRTVINIFIAVILVSIVLGAIASFGKTESDTEPLVSDEPKTEISNDKAGQSTPQESASIQGQDIVNIILDYQLLNGTTWTGQEDGLLAISDGLHDVNLVFSGREFSLTLKSVKRNYIPFQYTGRYEIKDEVIVFPMKRGDVLYGKIIDDIMTISNWNGDKTTFELRKQ